MDLKEELKKHLESQNFIKAQSTIVDFESSISDIKVPFFKQRSLKLLQELKFLYSNYDHLNVQPNSPQARELLGEFKIKSTESKLKIVEDCQEETAEGEEVLVKNCKDFRITAVSQGSLVMRNLENGVLYAVAEQIRMENCKNIEIFCYTGTGVFMEDCKAIVVGEYQIEGKVRENNMWMAVNDFSMPENGQNYTLMDSIDK